LLIISVITIKLILHVLEVEREQCQLEVCNRLCSYKALMMS